MFKIKGLFIGQKVNSWRFCSDKRFSEIPKIECSEQTVGS